MKKILIIGGSGFIGSSLIGFIEDNKFTDRYEILSLSRNNDILKRFASSTIRLIDGDILDESIVSNCMKDVDVVIHLAGGGGERQCLVNPSSSVLTNVLGTSIILKYAKENNVSKIIFASSIYSYSSYKKRVLPLKESDLQEPDMFYGALKVSCEHMIKQSGVPYVILRLSNVYGVGSGMYDQIGGAIGNFINSAISDEDIIVFNNGKNIMDYVNISDVVNAILLSLKDSVCDKVVNIGSGVPISVYNLACLVIRLAQKNKIIYSKNIINRISDSKNFSDLWIDISLAKSVLGWTPKISLEHGVMEMMHFIELKVKGGN